HGARRAERPLRGRLDRLGRDPAGEDQHQPPPAARRIGPARGRRRERGAWHGPGDRLHGRHVDLPGPARLRPDDARDTAQHHARHRARIRARGERVALLARLESRGADGIGGRVARLTSAAGRRLIAGSPTRPVLLMLIVLPFWTSFLLRVYAWIGLLKNNGVINNLLMALGVIHHPLALLQTDFAVYIGIVYSYLPFMILPLYANLE